MNARINEAGNVNWTALKQLSEQNKDEEPFDIYDLLSFHSFFNNLYNRKCSKNHHSGNQKPSQVDLQHTHHLALVEELNLNFTVSEINDVTKKLKNNKSVAEDLICNEMLKNSNEHMQLSLQKLSCLIHAYNRVYTLGMDLLQLPYTRRVTVLTPTIIGQSP